MAIIPRVHSDPVVVPFRVPSMNQIDLLKIVFALDTNT